MKVKQDINQGEAIRGKRFGGDSGIIQDIHENDDPVSHSCDISYLDNRVHNDPSPRTLCIALFPYWGVPKLARQIQLKRRQERKKGEGHNKGEASQNRRGLRGRGVPDTRNVGDLRHHSWNTKIWVYQDNLISCDRFDCNCDRSSSLGLRGSRTLWSGVLLH
jgi:hypothetical protein